MPWLPHAAQRSAAHDAITYNEQNKAVIDQDKCVGCGRCIGACNFDAIYSQCDSANEMLNRKMAEYAAAVCDGPSLLPHQPGAGCQPQLRLPL